MEQVRYGLNLSFYTLFLVLCGPTLLNAGQPRVDVFGWMEANNCGCGLTKQSGMGKYFFYFLLSSQIRVGRAISPDYMRLQLLVELSEPPLAVHHHPSSLSHISTEL